MQKARSRLGSLLTKQSFPPLLKKYLTHLPTLILALIGWWSVYYILVAIHPSSIRNLIIPNSYLPLLMAFELANFFTWSFVFLNSRRGLIISLYPATLLFLKLQQVILEPTLLVIFLVGWVAIYSLSEFFHRHQDN